MRDYDHEAEQDGCNDYEQTSQDVGIYVAVMSAALVDITTRDIGIKTLQKVEWSARTSHRSEEKMSETSWQRFLKLVLIEKADWSVAEHAHVTARVLVDRAIQQEWTRHRIGSYTIESTRFVNYEKRVGLSFIMPCSMEIGTKPYTIWATACKRAQDAYYELLRAGESPEVARDLLPLCLASQMVVTYNLRNWRHFFLMRTTKEAHPKMRAIATVLLAQFQELIPLLYDDITPGQRQRDNMKLPH